ncbi:MAG: hypothetical protein JWO67_6298 [Streptosporangiaceae bacterium]|nr:hypothetical protein [Streptosporangiaceae bacterium]
MPPVTGSYRVEGPVVQLQVAEEAVTRQRWWHRRAAAAKERGRWLRRGQIASVVFVAAVAFVQSWSHIYDIGHAHGQNTIDSSLLPLSVDGMIVSCSVTLARAAKEGREASPVTRLMLWLAVAATVAANVVYGLPFGWVGIASSAWPAIAFLGTVEGAFGGLWSDIRDRRNKAKDGDTGPGNAADSETDSGADTETDTGADSKGDTGNGGGAGQPPNRRRRKVAPKLQPKERQAQRLLDKNHALTGKELAARIGVDERTGQRYRRNWLAAKAGDTAPDPDGDSAADSKELAGVGS